MKGESTAARNVSGRLFERESTAARKVSGRPFERELTVAQEVSGRLLDREPTAAQVVSSLTERLDCDRLFNREACLTAPWIRGVGQLLSTNPTTAETLRPFKYVDKQFCKLNHLRFEDSDNSQSSLPTNPTTADTFRSFKYVGEQFVS